jgi:hypothetical protein
MRKNLLHYFNRAIKVGRPNDTDLVEKLVTVREGLEVNKDNEPAVVLTSLGIPFYLYAVDDFYVKRPRQSHCESFRRLLFAFCLHNLGSLMIHSLFARTRIQ